MSSATKESQRRTEQLRKQQLREQPQQSQPQRQNRNMQQHQHQSQRRPGRSQPRQSQSQPRSQQDTNHYHRPTPGPLQEDLSNREHSENRSSKRSAQLSVSHRSKHKRRRVREIAAPPPAPVLSRIPFIPGPVGVAVAARSGGVMDPRLNSVHSSKRSRRGRGNGAASSKEASTPVTKSLDREEKLELVFQQGPWLTACHLFGRVPPRCKDRKILVDWNYNETINIYKIQDIAAKRLVMLNFLVVLVDQINHRNGVIELRVRDESGFAAATVHAKAAEMHSTTLVPGSVLLLKNIKVWRNKHPLTDSKGWASFFLNITANNLDQVIPANSDIPESMSDYPKLSSRYSQNSQLQSYSQQDSQNSLDSQALEAPAAPAAPAAPLFSAPVRILSGSVGLADATAVVLEMAPVLASVVPAPKPTVAPPMPAGVPPRNDPIWQMLAEEDY